MYDDVDKVFARASEISEMGLSIPQVSSLFARLAADGCPVNSNVYTVQQAKEELLQLLASGKGGVENA